MKCLKLLLLLIAMGGIFQVNAQKKSTVVKNTAKPYKVPKLRTVLGQYSDTVQLPAEEAEKIIGLPLAVFDNNRNKYSISSYQFMYRKKGVTEDEETGKVTPATSISSNRFKTSPLPAIWVSQVKDQIKKGEELVFFDIVVKDAQGRVMYAPNLMITIF